MVSTVATQNYPHLMSSSSGSNTYNNIVTVERLFIRAASVGSMTRYERDEDEAEKADDDSLIFSTAD